LAQSKTARCSGFRYGAPANVIAPQQKLLAADLAPGEAERRLGGERPVVGPLVLRLPWLIAGVHPDAGALPPRLR
jgi:hypothetical protein